jgi:hypothetical protein
VAIDATHCASDDECVVSNFPGCCACPQCSQGEPRAWNRTGLEQLQANCAHQECDNENMCAIGGMCPPGEDAAHFSALCRNGTCTLRHR